MAISGITYIRDCTKRLPWPFFYLPGAVLDLTKKGETKKVRLSAVRLTKHQWSPKCLDLLGPHVVGTSCCGLGSRPGMLSGCNFKWPLIVWRGCVVQVKRFGQSHKKTSDHVARSTHLQRLLVRSLWLFDTIQPGAHCIFCFCFTCWSSGDSAGEVPIFSPSCSFIDWPTNSVTVLFTKPQTQFLPSHKPI